MVSFLPHSVEGREKKTLGRLWTRHWLDYRAGLEVVLKGKNHVPALLELFRAAVAKIQMFRDITPCPLVNGYRHSEYLSAYVFRAKQFSDSLTANT